MRFRGGRTPVALTMVLIACVSGAWAQGDYALMLNPEAGAKKLRVGASAMQFGAASAGRRRTRIGLTETATNGDYRFTLSPESNLHISWDVESLYPHGTARLRRSRTRIPGDLHGFDAGTAYRRELDNGCVAGATLHLGWTLDDYTAKVGVPTPVGLVLPLFDASQLYGRGMAFVRIPHGQNAAWLLFADADTRRHRPVLPGVGYQFPAGPRARVALGFPFASLTAEPTDKVAISAFLAPLTEAHAELAYEPNDTWRTSLGFAWDRHLYARNHREEHNDRLVFEDKRIKVGLEWKKTRTGPERNGDEVHMSLGLFAGYAFDRSFAEGEDRHEEDRTRLTLGDTWFAGASAKLHW